MQQQKQRELHVQPRGERAREEHRHDPSERELSQSSGQCLCDRRRERLRDERQHAHETRGHGVDLQDVASMMPADLRLQCILEPI